MKKILKDESFRLSIILTIIFIGTGIVFLLAGLSDYSWVLFGLLPIVLGIAIGSMKAKKYAVWGAVITTVLLLIGIYIPGLSGVICIVMAIIIVVPFIFLGYVVTVLVKRYWEIKGTDKLSLLILPLIPFLIAAPLEHFVRHDKEAIIEVRTERIFNYTPDQVYSLQAEYRWNFYKRWGMVAFAGVASAVANFSEIPDSQFLPGVGAGVRFRMLPSEKINIGIDGGVGKGDYSITFRIGESFGR
jgi:hypothetical protein